MSHDEDDAELVAAIGGQDADAMHALYQRYGLELLNYLIAQMQDRRWAEEVLQAVMLAVWQSARNFRAESSVRTWLYAITRRQIASAWRARGTDALPLFEQDAPSDDPRQQIEAAERREALINAIGELPDDQQQALEWFFFRGLSLAEAAAQMHVNLNTFKSKLQRAKKALREKLEESEHG